MKTPVQFGNYFLLERVAAGGMAEVFRAKSVGREGTERVVALKRILPMVAADKELVSLFIDEAKLVIQLNNPNLCKVFDWGKVEDNYYLAMEYISGCTLRQAFQRCKDQELDGTPTMPLAQSCLIAMKLCEGLDYAHNKKDTLGNDLGLVHRDVSPPNVMISYEGEVKLIDFGIAKVQAHRHGEASAPKGKFSYMSPEQVRGEPLDRRSDIFSLGIVLYELLTGERLFPVDNDMSALDKIRNVEILPPSTINRRIPEELERIVMKALSRNPADRYQTATEMNSDLQQSLYASGEFYSRKELAAWMKRVFKPEYEAEQAALDAAREFRPPSLPSSSQNEPLAKARQTMQIAALRVPGEGTGALRVPKDPTGAFRVGKDGALRPAGSKDAEAPSSWTPSRGKSKRPGSTPPPPPKQTVSSIAEAASSMVAGQRGSGKNDGRQANSPIVEDTKVDPPMLSGRVVEASWSGENPRALETIPNRFGPPSGVPSAIDEGPTQGHTMRNMPDMTGESAPSAGLSDPGDAETRAYSPLHSAEEDAHDQADTILQKGAPVVAKPAAAVVAAGVAPVKPASPVTAPPVVPVTAPPVERPPLVTPAPVQALPKPPQTPPPVSSPPVAESEDDVPPPRPSGPPKVKPSSGPPPSVMPPPPLSLPPTLDVGSTQQNKPQKSSRAGLALAILLLLVAGGAGAAYWMFGRSGEVVISTDPAREVIVLVDQKPVAMTDSPVILRLQPGSYAIAVQHNGYHPWTDKLSIAAGETVKRTIKLEAIVHKTGGFTLISNPPGATVTLDGASLGGVTPLRVQSVLVGPHTLEVRLGNRIWRQQVIIEEGKTAELQATLPPEALPSGTPTVTPMDPAPTKPEVKPEVKPEAAPEAKPETKPAKQPAKPGLVRPGPKKRRPGPTGSVGITTDTPPAAAGQGNFGYLRINSRPWSKIIVDGLDTGLNTPQTSYRVTPGTHQVTLYNPQFNIRETITIRVGAGETATITKTFQR
ncbi:MAG: protein kinase [Myxococcales bacterium]|nr:protein kinase [Myxococcales bacterium]